MTRQQARPVARSHKWYSRWCLFHGRFCFPLGVTKPNVPFWPVTFDEADDEIAYTAMNDDRYGLDLV